MVDQFLQYTFEIKVWYLIVTYLVIGAGITVYLMATEGPFVNILEILLVAITTVFGWPVLMSLYFFNSR